MLKKFYDKDVDQKALETLSSTKDVLTLKMAQAIVLVNKFNMTLKEVGDLYQCSPGTVMTYRIKFTEAARNDGRCEDRRGGRTTSYLSLEDEKNFLEDMSERAACGEITTVSLIKEEFEKRVGTEVNKTTIYRLLDRHEWRKVAPRPRHPKSDKEAQEVFKKNAPNYHAE